MTSIRIPRRSLLAAGVLAAPARVAAQVERPRAEWGAATGDVTADRALIWSRADRSSRMIVEWATDESLRNATRVQGPVATEASDYTARLDLTGLPADAEIFYRVSFVGPDAGGPLSAPIAGRFRTAPAGRRDVRFLWSADTAGQGWGIDEARGGFTTYEAMRRTGVDFFVHVGDTIYADSPIRPEVTLPDGTLWKNLVTPEVAKVAETLGEFRGRYRYNLLDRNVRAFNAEIPQVWMWDDHEVVNNWSDSTVLGPAFTEKRIRALSNNATRAFMDYAPMRPNGADEGERVYRTIHYGPQLDVFCLDMRSYRGPNTHNRQEREGPETAFLGRAQVDWLLRGLIGSRATWKVIASDMPLGLVVRDGKDAEGRDRFEAVANGDGPPLGRELELSRLLAAIKAAGVTNTIWLTADVHYTAAHRYDPARAQFRDFLPFWEFVSGPLQAGGFGPNALDDTFGPELVWQKAPPPGRVNVSPAESGQYFGEVAIEGRSGALTVLLKDGSGTALWQRSFEQERR